MTYLRISAAVMTLAVGTLIGFELRQRLADRAALLVSLGEMCREMLSVIETQGIPLGSIARQMSPRYEMMRVCCEKMSGGECFQEAFVNAVNEKKELRAEEKECLTALANGLGRSTEEAQKRLIAAVCDRLDSFALSARAEKNEKSKLYLNGGILAGLFAAVLMM